MEPFSEALKDVLLYFIKTVVRHLVKLLIERCNEKASIICIAGLFIRWPEVTVYVIIGLRVKPLSWIKNIDD